MQQAFANSTADRAPDDLPQQNGGDERAGRLFPPQRDDNFSALVGENHPAVFDCP
jgi:hypothetical protein